MNNLPVNQKLRKLIFKKLQQGLINENQLNEKVEPHTIEKFQKVLQHLGVGKTLAAIVSTLDDSMLNKSLDYIIKTHEVPMLTEIGGKTDMNPSKIDNSTLKNYLVSPEDLNEK